MEAVDRSNLHLSGIEKESLCRKILDVLELSTRFVSHLSIAVMFLIPAMVTIRKKNDFSGCSSITVIITALQDEERIGIYNI